MAAPLPRNFARFAVEVGRERLFPPCGTLIGRSQS
jgi:hypothetical protein